jgi:hypothetical protein
MEWIFHLAQKINDMGGAWEVQVSFENRNPVLRFGYFEERVMIVPYKDERAFGKDCVFLLVRAHQGEDLVRIFRRFNYGNERGGVEKLTLTKEGLDEYLLGIFPVWKKWTKDMPFPTEV